jgi:hypothetical protein
MHFLKTACAVFVLGMSGSSAFAQKPAAPTTETAPAVVPPPTLAPSAAPDAAPSATATTPPVEQPAPLPPAPPTLAAPPSGATIACVVGDHPHEYPDSARTAARLVCDALRQRGADVSADVGDGTGASAAYVVNIEQLGSIFYLGASYQEPLGVSKRSRRMSIYGLEEAEVAAPRLAEALLDEKSTEANVTYDSVVGSEQRVNAKKSGEFVVGLGLAAVSTPAAQTYMGPAFQLFGFYETRSWGIGVQGHVGDAAIQPHQTSFYSSFSVGARYYLSDEDLTPLLGGGLALSHMSESKNGDIGVSGGGTSAYLEAGIEAFRLHKTHFIATLRADLPFYKLSSGDADSCYDNGCSNSVLPPQNTRYEVPILLNVGIGF